jgi:hypothetical protein
VVSANCARLRIVLGTEILQVVYWGLDIHGPNPIHRRPVEVQQPRAAPEYGQMVSKRG